MNILRLRLFPIVVLAAAATAAPLARLAAQSSDSQAPEARAARVEKGLVPAFLIAGRPVPASSLAERMAALKVPGASVAVINDGAIEWAKGYGVTEVGTTTPVTTRTLFQAASISKPVAALAALRLVEQGRLALDEDVNAKLASWKIPESEFTVTGPWRAATSSAPGIS